VDPTTTWIARGGIVGLLAICIYFVSLLLRAYRQRGEDSAKEVSGMRTEINNLKDQHSSEMAQMQDRHHRECEGLRADNREVRALHWACEQKTNILIYALQRAGIPVPQEIWSSDGRRPERGINPERAGEEPTPTG